MNWDIGKFLKKAPPEWTVKITVAMCTPTDYFGGCIVSSEKGYYEYWIPLAELPSLGDHLSFDYMRGQVVSIIRDYSKRHIDVYADKR
jgi:hypothetical protein